MVAIPFFISLLNVKVLDYTKLKPFAVDNIDVNQYLKFDVGNVENIVVKGENAGYQRFLLLPQRFP